MMRLFSALPAPPPVYNDARFGFRIDVNSDNDRIIIVSPYSGHGFKHSAAIREAPAKQVINGKSKIDISGFSMKGFKDLMQ